MIKKLSISFVADIIRYKHETLACEIQQITTAKTDLQMVMDFEKLHRQN